MIKLLDVQGVTGVPIRVVIIPVKEASPNFPHVKREDEDLIEFYDRRYQHTPDGQFITRYFTSTLLETQAGIPVGGLDLYGGESAWKIDGRTMKTVRDWIMYHQYVKP